MPDPQPVPKAPAPAPQPPAPAPTPPSPSSLSTVFAGILYGFVAALILAGLSVVVWWYIKSTPVPGPDINVPSTVKAMPGRIVEIKVQSKASELQWSAKQSATADWDMVDAWGGRRVFFVAPQPGEYSFMVIGILNGHLTQPFPCTIIVGTPTPPKPPEPPTPPAPIPVAGLRMLVVYKLADMEKYAPGQRDILYSQAPGSAWDYMRKHGAKSPDGTAEVRMWDETDNVTAESQLWQDAFKRPRKSLPWVIISDGKTGYEGPLPPSTDEMMTLLQKYGG